VVSGSIPLYSLTQGADFRHAKKQRRTLPGKQSSARGGFTTLFWEVRA